MNDQSDWVGDTPPRVAKPFKDIRNTRPTVAEEKAQLLLQLGALIRACPASVRDGSVNKVRAWLVIRGAAAKVAGSSRSSTQQIRTAINSMNGYS